MSVKLPGENFAFEMNTYHHVYWASWWNIFHFGLKRPKYIVAEILWFRCNFANLSWHLLLRNKRLSSCNYFKQSILAPSSSNCTVVNFNVYHAEWGLQSLMWSSWVFCCFSEHPTVWSSGEFSQTVTCEKSGSCLECSPLVNNLFLCIVMQLYIDWK